MPNIEETNSILQQIDKIHPLNSASLSTVSNLYQFRDRVFVINVTL